MASIRSGGFNLVGVGEFSCFIGECAFGGCTVCDTVRIDFRFNIVFGCRRSVLLLLLRLRRRRYRRPVFASLLNTSPFLTVLVFIALLLLTSLFFFFLPSEYVSSSSSSSSFSLPENSSFYRLQASIDRKRSVCCRLFLSRYL